MTLKSTPARYGTVAIVIHWLSALLIVALLIAGLTAANTLDPDAKAAILRLHAPVGIAVLVLTLARIAWWLFADRRPNEAGGSSRSQVLLAKAVHALLYVAVLGLAASGIGLIALSGAGPILTGTAAGPLPDFWDYTARYAHAALARLTLVLLALHIGAALYHQFIRRDRLLARMGIGR